MTLEEYRESRRPFSELISIDPNEVFKLETEPERLTTRVLDLLSPLGMGQRCLIVAPPKAGKTTLLKDIAHGINTNHPDVTALRAPRRRASRGSHRLPPLASRRAKSSRRAPTRRPTITS